MPTAWLNGLEVQVHNEPMTTGAALSWPVGEARRIELDSGTLRAKDTDLQLAQIFAHEFIHGLFEHGRTKQKVFAGAVLVGVGAGAAAGVLIRSTPVFWAGVAVGGLSAYCKAAELSLTNEQEADIFGVIAISKITGDLTESKKSWQFWLNRHKPIKDENEHCFATHNPHPSMAIRINAVEFLEVQPIR
jgi:Zn-dependent protease with chaperone function